MQGQTSTHQFQIGDKVTVNMPAYKAWWYSEPTAFPFVADEGDNVMTITNIDAMGIFVQRDNWAAYCPMEFLKAA
jgi:hypothetical protein